MSYANRNKEALIKEIYSGISALAKKQAWNKEEAEDFLQEGLMCALQAIDKYPELPDNQLILVIARSAANRIFSVQRGAVVHHKRGHVEFNEMEHDKETDIEGNIDYRNFVKIMRARLPSGVKAIFDEKVEPSDKTLDILEAEHAQKVVDRKRGKLVMNVHDAKLQDVHIAKSLGISKATMSRGIGLIRSVAAELLGMKPNGQN